MNKQIRIGYKYIGGLMKKIILFMMLLFLIGCSSDENTDLNRVGVILSSLDNPFFMSIEEGMLHEASKHNFDIIILDSKNDLNLEKENFEHLIDQDVDIILLNVVDSDSSSEIVQKANDLEIDIITIDRTTVYGSVLSHISSDNYKGGILAGELVNQLSEFEDNLLILEGIIETNANEQRIAGFLSILDIEINIIGRTSAYFSREMAYETVKQSIEDKINIDCIFAANDEMAIGALEAVLEKKQNISVIGFDGTDEALEAVSNGYMAGTVAQQASLIGEISIKNVNRYLDGEDIEEEILVPLQMITIGN